MPDPRGACPSCHTALTTVRRARPWCPACEWNLDCFEPDRRPAELGWKFLDRLSFRVAYRLAGRQFRALAGRALTRNRWTPAGFALWLAASALLAFVAGALGTGIWLILNDFPSVTIVPGVLLVLIAVALWPRLGKVDRSLTQVTRAQAPTLYRLLDEVAGAVGAPVPQVVSVDGSAGAYCMRAGIRRVRVLNLGVVLWGVLSPQQRVALLGHEIGHFVNGDIRRGLLTQVPLTTLGRLADLFRTPRATVSGPGGWLAALVVPVLLRTVRGVIRSGHIVLVWLALRESQHAEYLADELAAKAGGGTAFGELCDTLLLADPLMRTVAQQARTGVGVEGWQRAFEATRAELAGTMTSRRQLSLRDEASLFAGHPPTELRRRMAESRPYQVATVVLSVADSARIDVELAGPYEQIRRDLARGNLLV